MKDIDASDFAASASLRWYQAAVRYLKPRWRLIATVTGEPAQDIQETDENLRIIRDGTAVYIFKRAG